MAWPQTKHSRNTGLALELDEKLECWGLSPHFGV